MQIKTPTKEYDVVIVGSGAGGGMSAKVLSEQGLSVAIVEAGPFFDPADPVTKTQMRWSHESPRRGRGTKLRPFGDFDMALGGWDIEGEPYSADEDTDGFSWFRSRMLGGRTNHWGRISLRFGPDDFRKGDIDGLSDNWPIDYEDVKPYYDKVDKLIGVFGTNEGLPNDPDGFFLPPPKPRLHELFYIKGARAAGVPVYPSRLSILTKRINNDRGVCFYCSQCSRSCAVYADFSSGSCLIFPAQKNGGQIDLFMNCMARSVVTNDEGKATAVSYINKEDRQEYQIRGKVIVLAASACSTARILMNSKSKQHPGGLGNGSGVLGRYLHDSTGMSVAGFLPQLLDRDIYNEDGVGGMHVYSPWWGDNKKLDFARGYHIEVWGGMGMPGYGVNWPVEAIQEKLGNPVGGFGPKLKDEMRRTYGAVVGISGRGEALAVKDNYCEINPNEVDEWGIPTLRFHYNWTEHERKQAVHMFDTFSEILDEMGGEQFTDRPTDKNNGLLTPGKIIHEVGTARMGDDPSKSVCNSMQQLHECSNVFLCDASSFVQQGDKNCTWTILALSWRTSDYIVEELKKMNI